MRHERTAEQRRFVYVGTYTEGTGARGVYACVLERDGRLTPIQTVADIANPSWLTLGPGRTVLYAVSEVDSWGDSAGGGATALHIDPARGRLTRLNDRPTTGVAVSAVVDPNGRYLLTANYAGASYSVLPITDDGRLRPAAEVRRVSGKGAHGTRQREPHPHDIAFDPSGRFVFGADLGTDSIWTWRLQRGRLIPHDPPRARVEPGAGPRQLAFHPSGEVAYATNELASSITVFRYDATRGTLERTQNISTAPPDSTGDNFPAGIAVHPDGHALYASNRGHDSIAIFTVDPRTGLLDAARWEPTGGRNPRHFAIDPSGRWVLVANQDSGNVVAFRIQPQSGNLTPSGVATSIPAPACVAFGPG